jgi:hypothetical protein
MSVEAASISSEFDIFASKPVQPSVQETTEFAYKALASVEQSDLEFLIPADSDTYIDLNIKLYIQGKLVKEDGKDLDATDHTSVTNNLLHSLFSQCNVTLNGISITQASELYPYRSYLETILTYNFTVVCIETFVTSRNIYFQACVYRSNSLKPGNHSS